MQMIPMHFRPQAILVSGQMGVRFGSFTTFTCPSGGAATAASARARGASQYPAGRLTELRPGDCRRAFLRRRRFGGFAFR